MEEVRGNGKSRIVQALNPDQRQKFERMLDECSPKCSANRTVPEATFYLMNCGSDGILSST